VTVLVSIGVLLATTGVWTTGFYVILGLVAILLGVLLCRLPGERARYGAFVFSVAVFVLTLLAYMKWRIYFVKYFMYLPSLSYLGFRAIAFLVTVYRRRRFETDAGLMQMLFFPMLFTGPISRLESFEESVWNYYDVLRRLVLGLGMLTAGTLCGKYVLTERMIREGATCSDFWISTFASSFDIYFNFSGWSHLVIGLGLLLGFKLPENFNYPYLTTSVSEFWRRWHMSLSFWIRDYLYIPLGGSRKGLARKCANLLIAMALCGLWHGLALHYLAWGLFHGVILASESIMGARNWQPVKWLCPAAHRPIKIATTFLLVTFSWLLFRYSIPAIPVYMRGLWPW